MASGGWKQKADDRVFHVKLIRILTVTRCDEERACLAMRIMLGLDCAHLLPRNVCRVVNR